MKLKLAVFDLDGTLLNTFGDLRSAVNAALSAYSLPARSEAEIKRFVGNGVRKLVERSVPTGTEEELTDRVFARFLKEYDGVKNRTTAPYDGIVTLLKILKRNGIGTAVLSNKHDAAVKALIGEMLPEIDFALGESDETPKKPDPAGVSALMKRFRVDAEETVLIGDAETDAETAKNAGVAFVKVLWGARTEEDLKRYECVFSAKTPAELLEKTLAYFALPI